MPTRVLLVDDDPNLLAGFRRSLRKSHALETAEGGEAGLEIMQGSAVFPVIISDMSMPGMNGAQFLAEVRRRSPDSTRIMLTGNADQQTAIEAINQGAIFRFLTKPCSPEDLILAIEAGVEHHRLVTAEKELLQKTLSGSIKVLTEVLSLVDPDGFGRAMQTRELVRRLARPLALERSWEIEMAAMMTPLGAMTLPAELRARSGQREQLSDQERELVDRMPITSSDLVAKIPRLEGVSTIIRLMAEVDTGTGQTRPGHARAAALLRILGDLVALEAEGERRSKAITALRSRKGRYDEQLLSEVLAELAAGRSEEEARAVTCHPSDLRIGDLIAADIHAIGGPLLIRAGQVVSQSMRESLRNAANLGKISDQVTVLRPAGAMT